MQLKFLSADKNYLIIEVMKYLVLKIKIKIMSSTDNI